MIREARRLVQRLQSQGYDSPYLDRLRAHLDVEERQEVLEVEIRSEMASALARSTMKVIAALLELELAEQTVKSASGTAKDAWEAYRIARDRALAVRLDLRIHREALGIRNNSKLDLEYPIPPLLPQPSPDKRPSAQDETGAGQSEGAPLRAHSCKETAWSAGVGRFPPRRNGSGLGD